MNICAVRARLVFGARPRPGARGSRRTGRAWPLNESILRLTALVSEWYDQILQRARSVLQRLAADVWAARPVIRQCDARMRPSGGSAGPAHPPRNTRFTRDPRSRGQIQMPRSGPSRPALAYKLCNTSQYQSFEPRLRRHPYPSGLSRSFCTSPNCSPRAAAAVRELTQTSTLTYS